MFETNFPVRTLRDRLTNGMSLYRLAPLSAVNRVGINAGTTASGYDPKAAHKPNNHLPIWPPINQYTHPQPHPNSLLPT